MNITIVGAGNIGTQFAVHCAEKGHNVTIYGSKPERISKELSIVDEQGKVIKKGIIKKATNDENEAFKEAELIFIAMPANMMETNASKIEPYVYDGLKIALLPGTGGGECAFKKCIDRGAVLFGLQRVPSVARLVEYGKIVKAVGYRDELFISAIPIKNTQECCDILCNILDMKVTALPNYLNITLTPSNPILHTVRLKTLYGDWTENMIYENIPLFYEDWNNESSELLIKCDSEVQSICKALSNFDLSYVKSLLVHYDSFTAKDLTNKIKNIKGFKGLESPKINVEGGYIPDFESRYFTADFSYGLDILCQIADFVKVNVQNMNDTLKWYNQLVKPHDKYRFSDYGINTFEEFEEFYKR